MSNEKPTPTPWKVSQNWNYQTIRSQSGAIVVSNESSDCDDAKNKANTALIVRAVNSFEAMREALNTFISIYPEKIRAHPDIRIAIAQARAALALADGEDR